ncbi:primase-helicase family protein [Bradyrhizobium cosmicum]|uniref:NrS-1 polymerase-like helicase domain-containing protein n=1 Tax=Bradyrhizobium cosmicum TaxID=1404864 RepID=A0AAI8M8E5_9BRAD|nr:primase-helicase family protein [Bradyrhizobium cosmicum]BAL73742.1 hypothetical protein S23_05210 [Bradyrhizobium cosmicum]
MPKIIKRAFVPLSEIKTVRQIAEIFFYVNVGGKPRLVHFVETSADGNALALEFVTDEDFKKLFANRRKMMDVSDPEDFNKAPVMRSASIAEIFLKAHDRPTYDRLVFEADPKRLRPTDFNMWNGFSVKPKKGEWGLMRAMIEESIANGDFEHFLWILKWCAWAVQNPTQRAEVCLAMRSTAQGTGKGLLGRTMCRFFGPHAQHIYRPGAVTGRFNSQLASCALLFDDESEYAGDPAAASLMKGLITEPTIDIERKGVDTITLPNSLKHIKATNKQWVAPVEAGDRRYAIFNTSEKLANDRAYFAPIYRQLQRDGGAGYSAMLYDLLNMDLRGWRPSVEIPNTDARAEQKELSLPAAEKWLLGYLESGVLPFTNPKWPNRVCRQEEFYTLAKRSSRELSFWSSVRFSKFLDSWGVPGKTSNGHYRDFGSLSALRARWMERYPWYLGFRTEGDWTYERSDFDDVTAEMEFG